MLVGRFGRIINTALGVWLYLSVFVWPHTEAQRANAVLTGTFIALTAIAVESLGPRSRLRMLDAALGFWLLVSIFAFPTTSLATQLNSAIVGVIVIAVSLLPAGAREADLSTA